MEVHSLTLLLILKADRREESIFSHDANGKLSPKRTKAFLLLKEGNIPAPFLGVESVTWLLMELTLRSL